MSLFPPNMDPELVARLIETGGGQLAKKMGIEFLELGAERSVATMPVEGNRQVIGLLHGGAHVVLAESLGSMSSAIHAGPVGSRWESKSMRPTPRPPLRASSPRPAKHFHSVEASPLTKSPCATKRAADFRRSE